MAESSRPNVSKLLRVLVAGGVALAGAAGTARAEEKPAGEKVEQVGDKEKQEKEEKEKAKAKEAEKAKAAEKARKAAKAAGSDGGGVRGW